LHARVGARTFGVVVATLPLVRYEENHEAVNTVLAGVFQNRFADDDLPQVFLSVLLLAVQRETDGPPSSPTPASLVDLDLTFKAATASSTCRAAVEWVAQDLLHALSVLRELSAAFSQPGSFSP
jgi:hypothetical protein